jgi:hypothetical protein
MKLKLLFRIYACALIAVIVGLLAQSGWAAFSGGFVTAAALDLWG